LGRGRVTFSLFLCIYTSHKLRWGVWGWVRGVLVPVWVCLKLVLPLPFSSLRQSGLFPKLFIILSCCQFINQQRKLCRCRIRNRQWKLS
jgi:hypothetical protein